MTVKGSFSENRHKSKGKVTINVEDRVLGRYAILAVLLCVLKFLVDWVGELDKGIVMEKRLSSMDGG